MPPALLSHARAVADEHGQLSARLSRGFDVRAARKLGETKRVVDALRDFDRSSDVRSPAGSGP